jgi:hypothetical protein
MKQERPRGGLRRLSFLSSLLSSVGVWRVPSRPKSVFSGNQKIDVAGISAGMSA